MMTARFLSGASLFALLIVDICCFPLKKGFNPSPSYPAINYGSYQGAPSGYFSPGVVSNYAPSAGVATPSYQPAPQPESTFSQPAVYSQPAAPTGPVSSTYRGSSVSLNSASAAQPGTTFQPAPREISWAVDPPTLLSGGEDVSAGTRGVGASSYENVSPPPGPVYQAGELSRYEGSFEHGDSERETEDQGYLSSAGPAFTSEPRPVPDGIWGPYSDYTYLFLTGQLPEGTVTHSTSTYEQGRDNWQDVHYERYYYPDIAAPVQQIQPVTDFSAPQRYDQPKEPVKASVPAASTHFRQPTGSQPGGNYMSKGGY